MLYNLFENRDFVSVFAVALLAEGVDRNHTVCRCRCFRGVALLAEGVDRNFKKLNSPMKYLLSPSSRRAWIEIQNTALSWVWQLSPSSRRAWIEIKKTKNPPPLCLVALLAEGVDRNISRSANAARFVVALLAEGVDRNHLCRRSAPGGGRRPPRGGRG